MSTAIRVISGTVASWAQIAVTMASQIALVPIYLSYWDVKTYGVWLAIHGIMGILSMLDLGFQNYMSFEFLKLGRNNIPSLNKSLSSAIVFATGLGVLQIGLIFILISTGIMVFLIGESGSGDSDLIYNAGIALVLQGITWLVLMSGPGLMIKTLAAFGYFAKTAWWNVVFAIVTAVAPLIAVVAGGDLLLASIALTSGSLIHGVALYVYLLRSLKKEGFRLVRPSFRLGFSNFLLSTPLLGKAILENVRQQGVRLLVAPLAGPVGLAAFSTMRTGSNVTLQGLNTIIHPLLPDLLRFLHDRDQPRVDAGFATLWIVVVAFIAPGIVILQAFAEPLFVLWTQGKITFDPLLFSLLSLGVLVYAVIQPAIAVVIGNNLTRIQLVLAAISAIIVLAVLAASVPLIGIVGAGIALLAAEIAGAVGYYFHAKRWLHQNDMLWPAHCFKLALASVLIASSALEFLLWMPDFKWLILGISMALFALNVWRYWAALPAIATSGFHRLLSTVPVLKRFVKTNSKGEIENAGNEFPTKM
ncbi:MAG: polysaccharide biosynthesis C-terminal domain-containing protein [Chryseolinea sp.]